MTGLRVGELLALRWQDIDFEKGFFSVRQTVYEGHFDVPKSKRSKRTLPLGPVCAEIFTTLRKPGVIPPRWFFRRAMAHLLVGGICSTGNFVPPRKHWGCRKPIGIGSGTPMPRCSIPWELL